MADRVKRLGGQLFVYDHAKDDAYRRCRDDRRRQRQPSANRRSFRDQRRRCGSAKCYCSIEDAEGGSN